MCFETKVRNLHKISPFLISCHILLWHTCKQHIHRVDEVLLVYCMLGIRSLGIRALCIRRDLQGHRIEIMCWYGYHCYYSESPTLIVPLVCTCTWWLRVQHTSKQISYFMASMDTYPLHCLGTIATYHFNPSIGLVFYYSRNVGWEREPVCSCACHLQLGLILQYNRQKLDEFLLLHVTKSL